ncbi:MAG: hypothetical protein AAGE52_01640 [Myxococcota bacterium]
MKRVLLLLPFLWAFDDGGWVLGPEFEETLTAVIRDPSVPEFQGAQIDRSRVLLHRPEGDVVLAHPSVEGDACGVFSLVDASDLSAEEVGALCARLAQVDDPFRRPEAGWAPGVPRWVAEHPTTAAPTTFTAGALATLVAMILGIVALLRREKSVLPRASGNPLREEEE